MEYRRYKVKAERQVQSEKKGIPYGGNPLVPKVVAYEQLPIFWVSATSYERATIAVLSVLGVASGQTVVIESIELEEE